MSRIHTPPKTDLKGWAQLNDEQLSVVTEKAIEFNSKYYHWDELIYRIPDDIDPDMLWGVMKLLRANTMKHVDFKDFYINYSVISDFQKITHNIDLETPVFFQSERFLDKKKKAMLSVSSIMEESIASSQIEGANTTTKVAKKMLMDKRSPKNKSENMIVNNYNAMQYIKKVKDEPLRPELICKLHEIITSGTLNDQDYEGRFRDSDDIVVQNALTGEIAHCPPEHTKIDSLITSICNYVNSDDEYTHPLIKGIILHYLIAYVHPFVDGNGRLARSLFYWYSLKKGYWLMEFLTISKCIKKHRQKYDLSYIYSESDDNDITYFIRFNLDCIVEAMDSFTDYLKKKMEEEDNLKLAIEDDDNLTLRQKSILRDVAMKEATFSLLEIQTKYQISRITARNDLLKLLDSGKIVACGKAGNRILYRYSDLDDSNP